MMVSAAMMRGKRGKKKMQRKMILLKLRRTHS